MKEAPAQAAPGARRRSAPTPTPTAPLLSPPLAGCETEGARLLRDICARLPDPAAVTALLEALAEGSGPAAITTFELLSSGTVAALKRYLQGADLEADASLDERARQLALLQRLGQFAGAGRGRGEQGLAGGAAVGWQGDAALLLLHACMRPGGARGGMTNTETA